MQRDELYLPVKSYWIFFPRQAQQFFVLSGAVGNILESVTRLWCSWWNSVSAMSTRVHWSSFLQCYEHMPTMMKYADQTSKLVRELRTVCRRPRLTCHSPCSVTRLEVWSGILFQHCGHMCIYEIRCLSITNIFSTSVHCWTISEIEFHQEYCKKWVMLSRKLPRSPFSLCVYAVM